MSEHVLRRAGQEARILDRGATLRTYTDSGRPVIWGFEIDDPWGCQGEELLPWPNRIRDGRYSFGGQDFQLPINEPARGNAIHGLVNHRVWQVAEAGADFVVHALTLEPEPGWPGRMNFRLRHSLGAEGLLVEVWAKNVGEEAVPFGYGAHPYVAVMGDEPGELLIPADRRLDVDDRLLPIAIRDVADTAYDFREERPVDLALDTAFTGLRRDPDGRWRAKVTSAGQTTTVWGDETMSWIQCFTPPHNNHLALEPLTCGPDAFNEGPTHAELLVLEPGEEYTGTWGVTPG